MKEVVVVLLVALMLNGCGSSTPTAQTASGGVWQSQMSGGAGESSGFSFVTQFTVGGNGALSISNFQFLTSGTCFPVNGGTESGTLVLTSNSADVVSGTFSFTITSGGNTLTLASTSVTGSYNPNTNEPLTGGTIIGTWALQGSTSSCTNAMGTFTMTQTS